MKSTTLFSIYATLILVLLAALGFVSLYSLHKAVSWDKRIQLAQESYALHLQLEANVFRLFKQHGDALLIGDRDNGAEERDLSALINQNIADIRQIIAREIELVGEDEIEELNQLEMIESDIREVNRALRLLSAAGEPLETDAQIESLADLLDREIDVHLSLLIADALQEEVEEVEETLADAASFRQWNTKVVYALLLLSALTLLLGFMSFNRQIYRPLKHLEYRLKDLRRGKYATEIELGGCREFRELSKVMGGMMSNLADREASREEQKHMLETTVERRTSELQQLIDKLELGEQNRKRLMADISHELRTPLAIILGEAEVALRNDDSLSETTSDTLALIRDSAKHTNQIVNDMLTVARQEAGQLRLDRRETDLRSVIEEAANMFPGDITLNLPVQPALLSVDGVRLRQCVLALLHNAKRYGGPKILTSLTTSAEGFQIVVEDNGYGLSREEQSQALNRFFRGSNTSAQGSEGSGLGLPIAKSIVEAHGGQMTLGDSEHGGLRVQIDLPAYQTLRSVDAIVSKRRA